MRRFALTLSILGCLSVPATSLALGLGAIDVNTTLGQPLKADIRLLGATPEELQGLHVRLASPRLFSQVDLPRPDYLDNLKFKLVKDASGQPYIEVTSAKPLKQPFLDFLVEVSWPGGRLVREYTILLNPPNYMQGKPVASVSAPTVAPMGAPKPILTTQPASAGAGAQTQSASTYKVKPGDTLYKIASQVAPSSPADINQKMIAILKANPRAFVNGNINGLMQGYVLRIPPADQMSAINAAQAAREVSRQDSVWRAYSARLAGKQVLKMPAGQQVPAALAAAVTTTGPAASKAAATGKLKILGVEPSAAHSGQAGASATTGGSAAIVAKLKHELALVQEATVSNQQQLSDLNSRVQALQAIVQKQQKLIDLKNQELAALQQQLGTHATPAPATTQAASPAAAAGTASPAAAQHQATPAPGAHPKSAAPAAAIHPKPVAPASQTSGGPSLLDTFLNNPNLLMAAGGALLLLLALLLLAARRKSRSKGAMAFDEAVQAAPAPDEAPAGAVATAAAGAAAAVAAGQAMETGAHGAGKGAASEAVSESIPQAPGPAAEETASEPSAPPAHEDAAAGDDFAQALARAKAQEAEDDILAEADVYIAYGLFQQAEDVLRRALAQAPDRNDYRAKLLEAYYGSKNTADFVSTARELHDRLAHPETDPLWLRAATLGKKIAPDEPLFANTDTGDLTPEDVLATEADTQAPEFDDTGLEFDLADELPEAQALEAGETDHALDSALETQVSPATAHAQEAPGPASVDATQHETSTAHTSEMKTAAQGAAADTPPGGAASDTGISEAPTVVLETGSKEDKTPDDALEALDFDLGELETQEQNNETRLDDEALDLDFGGFDELEMEPEKKEEEALDLDLDTFSFDLDEETEHATQPAAEAASRIEGAEETAVAGAEEETAVQEAEPFALGEDTADTNLDLAKAYMDMGDTEGARSALEEVLAEGNEAQKKEAQSLLEKLG